MISQKWFGMKEKRAVNGFWGRGENGDLRGESARDGAIGNVGSAVRLLLRRCWLGGSPSERRFGRSNTDCGRKLLGPKSPKRGLLRGAKHTSGSPGHFGGSRVFQPSGVGLFQARC